MPPSVPYEVPGFKFSLEASADLSAGQYRALVIDSNGQGARAGQGVAICGIQQDKPSALGRVGEVMQTGISKGAAGAAVSYGDKLMTDANGKFVTATATDFVIGFAMTEAAAEDEIISVLLQAMDIAA